MWQSSASVAEAAPDVRHTDLVHVLRSPADSIGATSDDLEADLQAMRNVQRGDADALEWLYDRHHRAAMALAYRILIDRASAEDAVQESFLSVWRRAPSFDATRGDPRRWILSIVHHRCIDRLRRRAVAGPTSELKDDLLDDNASDVFQEAYRGLLSQDVRAALAQIPAEQREAIELAYFGGLTQQEIAALQGVPLGTAKGRVRIGLQKLKSLLESCGYAA
jgi:RNA polymerase sigma-70 factor (ECF subfamily)